MTVKDYLDITEVRKLEFLVSAGRFEKISAINEKWGKYCYPPDIRKWLDKEICQAFVMSNGTLRIICN